MNAMELFGGMIMKCHGIQNMPENFRFRASFGHSCMSLDIGTGTFDGKARCHVNV